MLVVLLFFVIGFLALVKGADWLVEGAQEIAARFNIPDLVIGLTVVALGTSAPELTVNVLASLGNHSDIAFGNVLGSNAANVLLILGVCAVIKSLHIPKSTFRVELPLSLFLVGATYWFSQAAIQDFAHTSVGLGRGGGIALLVMFAGFWGYTIYLSLNHRKNNPVAVVTTGNLGKSGLKTVAGIVGLYLGGKWVVENAITLARLLEVSEALIAVSLVALGTSLPELVTSIIALRKKQGDIIVGNAIGSNIFNIAWVLGLSAVINPIPYYKAYNADILINLVAGFLLMGFVFFTKGKILNRGGGILFLVLYGLYLYLNVQLKSVAPS